jgi:hypothetical protein
MTRTYDGRTATATANYTVTGQVAAPFLMGQSLPDGGKSQTDYPPPDCGYNQIDAIRCYDFPDVNRILAYDPKVVALTGGGGIQGGQNTANDLEDFLASFYEGAPGFNFSNMPLAQRQNVEIHYANGNEFGSNVTNVASFVNTLQAIYNVIHQASWSRFPKASAWVDPTHFQENNTLNNGSSGQGSPGLDQTIDGRYLDGVAWSMYPPGRETTSPDPTYSMPSFNESNEGNLQSGFLIRCWTRTRKQALAAGKPANGLWISCWEIGIGDDPNDRTHRPWYLAHQLAGGFHKLNLQFNMTMKVALYWNQQVQDQQGVIQSENPFNAEPTNTNPKSVQVWRDWMQYNHEFGGTHPAAWVNNPQKNNTANPQSTWKRNGATTLA